MARVPKVVGVRQNTKDGLWKEFGERLVRKGLQTARGRRGNASRSSRARLERAWAEQER